MELKDLDFYLTIIYLFCQYNETTHYSDIMFADITADIAKRDAAIEILKQKGYITADKSRNFPHRYKVDITPLGKSFYLNGGFTGEKKDMIKYSAKKIALFILSNIIVAIITAYATTLFTQ